MAKTSTIVSAAVRLRLPTPGLIIFKETSRAEVAGPPTRPAHAGARRRLSDGKPARCMKNNARKSFAIARLKASVIAGHCWAPRLNGVYGISLRRFYVLAV
jgi:hypothetical protein